MKTTKNKPCEFLEGNQIFLRPLTESDVDGEYGNWLNDPEVCAQNSHAVFPLCRDNLIEYVRRVRNSQSEVVLAIIAKIDNRHIGNVALQNIHWINRSAEFAMLLGAKDCWGQGYGTQAAAIMVQHGFNALGLRRITFGTFEANLAVRNIAAKLGFVEEGLRRKAVFKNGIYVDVVEFGLLKDEFKNIKHA